MDPTRSNRVKESLDNSLSRKKPRSQFSHRYSDLVRCFGDLLNWMILNEKAIPIGFYSWVLGDGPGWKYFMQLTQNPIFLSYSLESLRRTVAPLCEMLKKPATWKSQISIRDFRWFMYLYQNRHCLGASLVRSHPFHSILKCFRANAMQTALDMTLKSQKERMEHNRIVEIFQREKAFEDVHRYVGKIVKRTGLQLPMKDAAKGFHFIEPPSDIEHIEDGVSFILRDKDHPEIIIGGRIAGAVPEILRCSLRKQMLQLMSVKPTVQRGAVRKAFCSNMCSFGATKNQDKGSSGLINFVVSKKNNRCKLQNKVDCANTDIILYKYGFTHLQEIIILCFLRHFPEGILDLLRTTTGECTSPYMGSHNIGIDGRARGPLMWSLHVTMNYINCIHVDTKDRSLFSLAVVSNTNKETRGGEFHLFSHGVSFTQCDRDLFFFQGKMWHGTSFREMPADPVLVSALVMNSSVTNIINSELSQAEDDHRNMKASAM